MTRHSYFLTAISALLLSCGGGSNNGASQEPPSPAPSSADDGSTRESTERPFTATEVARFDEPWAMAFILDTPYALITEKPGRLVLFNISTGTKIEVSGVPQVEYGGQGGFGDVVLAPDDNSTDDNYPVYLSWVEPGSGDTGGAVVARGTVEIDETGSGSAVLSNLQIIWRQVPKVTGRGHFSHRIAVAPDGQHIFISSGDRQKMEPAQDMDVNLGKIVRLKPDGSAPADNPFADQGGVAAQIWTLGNRNVLGLSFDRNGQLWASEMGPQGGDEVNLIQRGENYGWPRASNGSHYGGAAIPDHGGNDAFTAPKAWWTPSISPAGIAYYSARLFPQWYDSLLLGALSGEALVRLRIEGNRLVKASHWPMDARIREVEVAPDGSVWLLEDGADARLLKLTPAP